MFLASYTYVWLVMPIHELPKHDPAPSYVPSYVQNNTVPPTPPAPTPIEKLTPRVPQLAKKPLPAHKNGIEKPKASAAAQKTTPQQANPGQPRQVRFARNQAPEEINDPQNREPMHLIGETKIMKPLIKILAKSLSEHLTYPKIAADFNLRGVVLVGFVLHPQGYVTETKIVKSSGAGVLDDAARKAVNAMSPVSGVGVYMQKPEFLVVGIIFGGLFNK